MKQVKPEKDRHRADPGDDSERIRAVGVSARHPTKNVENLPTSVAIRPEALIVLWNRFHFPTGLFLALSRMRDLR